jgi:phenylacetate-CoA ligase
VSVMGANLYPEDVEQALYDQPDLAAQVNSFCLGLRERPDGTQVPLVALELRESRPDDRELRARLTRDVVTGIAGLNADFRTALREHADSVRPVVELHAPGAGPFARDRGRIKQVRLLPTER